MTMATVTGWQIAWVFLLYSVLVMALPAMVFRPRLRKKRLTDRFLFCLVVGNFWIITVTLLLLLIGIANAFTVLLFTYGGALLIVYARNRAKVNHFFKLAGQTIWWLVRGELRGGLYLHRGASTLGKQLRRWFGVLGRWLRPRWVELTLLTVCMIGSLWFTSYQVLNIYCLGTSDLVVHVYWLNSALEGTVMVAGVYPFGYHALLYYLKVISGVDSLALIRVMGVVQSSYITLMLYLLARQLCRCKYSAVLALIVFTLTSAFDEYAVMRYQWSLPQEYAMLFLYPMALYLQQFYALSRKLRRKDAEPVEQHPALQEKDAMAPPRTRPMQFVVRMATSPLRIKTRHVMLILFGMCLSLTLTVHMYVTIAAGFLCVGVTAAYLTTVVRPRCFLPLAASVALAVVVAVAPLAAAYVSGKPLEGSLLWGVSIIEGTDKDSKDADSIKPDDSNLSITEKAKNVLTSAYDYIQARISPKWWCNLSVGLLLLAGLVSLLGTLFSRRSDRMRWWLGIVLYIGLLLVTTRYRSLGLLPLMEDKRSAIFVCYAIALLYAMPFELLYGLLKLWHASTRACNAVLCALCVLAAGATRLPVRRDGRYPAKRPSIYFCYQYPSAIAMLYDLYAQYPAFSWTLVSSVNENQLVYDHGRHYDLSTFLLDVEDWTEEMEVTIPTPYVFFMMEKRALEYNQTVKIGIDEINATPISDELAAQELPKDPKDGPTSYYRDYRALVMSKANAYIEALKKLYPDDLTVYYEDENTICYRLTQNVLELYDLAIDYGYNRPAEGGEQP